MTRARDLAKFNLDGQAVTINESSADLDFRVESNGNANMLFVDGGNNHVNIGSSTDANGVLNVSDGTSFSTGITVENTGDTHGSVIDFLNNSESPADNDYIGGLIFKETNSAGGTHQFAKIFGIATDITDGTEDGAITFETSTGGASTAELLRITDTATFGCPVTISTIDNLAQLTLKSTDADSGEGPVLILQRDSGSPADNDTAGKIYFYADNDAGEVTTFASLEVQLDDVSDGTEDAGIRLKKMYEGSLTEMVRFAGGGEFVFMSPQSFTGEQRHKFEWWNENLAGIMAKISVNREASYQAPGALTFFTSTNVDSSSNNSQGEISEKFRIASNGDLTATDTSIASNSDSRLKTSIADFTYDLDKFKAFKTKTFDWKSPSLHGGKTGQRGFLAQDLESVDTYWTDKIEVESDSSDYQYLEDEDILWGENNSYMPKEKSATDVERVARFAKTSKLGQKEAMYVSIIQQLITKIETLETKVKALEDA